MPPSLSSTLSSLALISLSSVTGLDLSPTSSGSTTGQAIPSIESKRTVIGPLTTIHTPLGECSKCYYQEQGTIHSTENVCIEYATNCFASTTASCLPDVERGLLYPGFYSPGIFCPSGWTTATTISPGTNFQSLMYTTLYPDETAVLCCPKGMGIMSRTYDPNAPDPNDIERALHPPVYCNQIIDAKLTPTASYRCATDYGPPDNRYNSSAITAGLVTIMAPAVQLVWRKVDRPSSTNARPEPMPITSTAGSYTSTPPLPSTAMITSSLPASTSTGNNSSSPAGPGIPTPESPTPLSPPPPPASHLVEKRQLAGFIVGSTLTGALICGGVAWFLHRRRRRRERSPEPELPELETNDLPRMGELETSDLPRLAETSQDLGQGHDIGEMVEQNDNAEGRDKQDADLDWLTRHELPSPCSPVELEGSAMLPSLRAISGLGMDEDEILGVMSPPQTPQG